MRAYIHACFTTLLALAGAAACDGPARTPAEASDAGIPDLGAALPEEVVTPGTTCGGALGASLEAGARRFARAVCERTIACSDAVAAQWLTADGGEDLDACEAASVDVWRFDLLPRVLTGVSAGLLEVDVAGFASCADACAAAPCGDPAQATWGGLQLDAACRTCAAPYRERGRAGWRCDPDGPPELDGCGLGSHCAAWANPPTPLSGTCAADAPLGGACSSARDCGKGRFCFDGACAEPKAEGEPCTSDTTGLGDLACAAGLACRDAGFGQSLCQAGADPRPAEGSICEQPGTWCTSLVPELQCYVDLDAPLDEPARCVRPARFGEPCQLMGTLGTCGTGLVCEPEPGTQRGTCRVAPDRPDCYEGTMLPACAGGAPCVDGTCRDDFRLAAGGPCTRGPDCDTGYCLEGACQPWGTVCRAP